MGNLPTLTDEYRGIHTRLDKLRQRYAVLASEEERRKGTREKLAAELKAGGVDLADLPGEKVRLQGEVERLQAESVQLVDEFEKRLDAVEQGEPCEPVQETEVPTQDLGHEPPAGGVEID